MRNYIAVLITDDKGKTCFLVMRFEGSLGDALSKAKRTAEKVGPRVQLKTEYFVAEVDDPEVLTTKELWTAARKWRIEEVNNDYFKK